MFFSKEIFQSTKGLLILILAGILTMLFTLFSLATLYPSVENTFSKLSANLIAWDTGWYYKILTYGYFFIPDQQSNTAFFPLLPWIWALLNKDAILVSLFNLSVSIVSLCILKHQFAIKNNWGLILLFLFPPFLFMHVPYAEALFFFGSTFVLIALLKEKWSLGVLGFLIVGFARPSCMVLIPGLILLYLIKIYTSKNHWRKNTIEFIIYLSMNVIALLVVLYIQYTQTNVWNAYGKAIQNWGFGLEVPRFPFYTMKDGDIYYLTFALDSIAYGIALIAFFFLIKAVLQILKTRSSENIDYPFLFSCSYIFLVVFFRLISQDGSLHSINRYVFCTPFAFLILHKLYVIIENKKVKARDFYIWIVIVFFSVAINIGEAMAILLPVFCLIGIAFYLITNRSIYLTAYYVFLFVLFAILHSLAFIGHLQMQWVA